MLLSQEGNNMAMFTGAKNVVVHGSSFVANLGSHPRGGLDKLVAEVAPNAILNAGGRADEVRCFPGTREEVIGKLERFMDENSPDKKRMMWLSGPAGAGKSAILQSVAERGIEQGRHAANFFFFRGDNTRSHSKPLVATLVYQLRRFYPALNKALSNCLEADPLICSASIEAQFKQLISSPFQTILKSTPTQRQIVIIVDGLDECNDETRDQDQILVALHTLAYADRSPFLVLVSSRAEPQLVMSFNRLGNSVESIFLNDDYKPEKDIRLFVVAKFAEIKRNHHLAQTLTEEWPITADIEAIIKKSSGQFIYAVTVMRFIEFSSSSPALSLVTIIEMPPSTGHNPLANLDAIYSYIFSKVHDLRAVKLILFARYCSKSVFKFWSGFHFRVMLKLAGFGDIKVQSLFADLAAIIRVVPGSQSDLLVFYHASLKDYLSTKSRSTIYCVNDEELATELSSMCLRKIHNAESIQVTSKILDSVQKPTPELFQSWMDASTRHLDDKRQVPYLGALIGHIERLYWEHDKDQFKVLLQSWSRFVNINNIDKDSSDCVRTRNSSASHYYKQYWMTTGNSRQKYPTQPNTPPAGIARSNTQQTLAVTSPNAAIGGPIHGLSIRKLDPSVVNMSPDKSRGSTSALAVRVRNDNQVNPTRPSPNTATSGGSARDLSVRRPRETQRNVPTVPPKGKGGDPAPARTASSNTRIKPVGAAPPNAAISSPARGASNRKPAASLVLTAPPRSRGGSTLGRKVTPNQPASTSRASDTHNEEEGHGSRKHDDALREPSTIMIKLHYRYDMRRMTFSPNTTFSEFVDKVTAKLGRKPGSLTMKFKDRDGNKITLRDDSDFEVAIEVARQSRSEGKTEGKLEIWCKDTV